MNIILKRIDIWITDKLKKKHSESEGKHMHAEYHNKMQWKLKRKGHMICTSGY